ncbi:hypothetical protein LCGC14_2065060 [marine sediment metagenome]|uniref:HEAT repeat domain-containing protein n=2 Tax=root TaxID=1 RepID=A0A7V1D0A6_9GAMM|nr:HEAT repeat domain-containing protein [Pseudoalteromonas prydzensis]HEA17509.1 HEAT repeat domain-containing protein [Pseudoalteromonas prydzensis]
MPINKGSVAIVIATIAIAISCYGTFFAKHVVTPHTKQTTLQQNGSEIVVTNIPLNSDYNELSIDLLNKKITALELQLANLQIQNPAFAEAANNDDFKELVLAVLNEKEQQVQAKMRASNPYHAFYSELPDDYELRIKSDPQYAQKMATQLREQILNPNISDAERLVALNQLQLNMNILNKQSMPEYDFAVIDSLFNLAINSTDGNFKIQAIETVTQTPVLDYRVVEKFTQLLETDNNDYVRRLAVQGLVMQYYQAQNEQTGYSQQVAQHLLSLYKNPTDNDVKTLLDEVFGNQKMLDELQNHATGGS